MTLSVASTSTTTTGTSATPTVNVPSGVAAGEGVLVVFHTNNAQTINVGATGFVHAPGSPLASPTTQFSLNVLFKVATGNDTGTYAFTTAGSDFWCGGASRITGGPSATWDTNSGTGTAVITSSSSASLNTSMTTQAANELLIGAGDQFNGGTWTFTGVTKVTDVDSGNKSAGYGALLKTSAGATGTITNATAGAASQMVAWLGALVPAGGAAAPTNGPLVATRPWVPLRPPGAQLFASQPLGNPAVGTPGPRVVSTPWTSLRPPGATLFASQPLGNPAQPTPRPLVVSSPWAAKVPGALLFGPGAPAVITPSAGTPGPMVVTPPFAPVPIPPSSITASQPLGNPAVGSPEPLVVSQPWTSKVPGALTFGPGAPTAAVVTGSTPGPLVVVPAFTLAPVPGARVFAAPQAPVITSAATPGPYVVTPQWQPVPIPRTVLSASYPLGRPAVPTPQPLVVTPVFRWPTWTASIISDSFVFVAPTSCDTPRPFTGITTYGLATTARPGSGTTAYALATTARPNTGETDPPCG